MSTSLNGYPNVFIYVYVCPACGCEQFGPRRHSLACTAATNGSTTTTTKSNMTPTTAITTTTITTTTTATTNVRDIAVQAVLYGLVVSKPFAIFEYARHHEQPESRTETLSASVLRSQESICAMLLFRAKTNIGYNVHKLHLPVVWFALLGLRSS